MADGVAAGRRIPRTLVAPGRHSRVVYLGHQLVLIRIVWLCSSPPASSPQAPREAPVTLMRGVVRRPRRGGRVLTPETARRIATLGGIPLAALGVLLRAVDDGSVVAMWELLDGRAVAPSGEAQAGST